MLLSKISRRAFGMAAAPVSLIGLAWTLPADAGQGKTAAPVTGEKVYQLRCASCHGAKGEGAKAYPKPLAGSRSVNELSRFIAQSMPPVGVKCPAPEAQTVAAYVYDTFYSPLAQARNKPARIVLSRLTVPQFRNAVADLIGAYHAAIPAETKHGLQGAYYKAQRFDNGDRLLQRVDNEVKFDFGTAGPVAEQFDPHHFSIRWEGSVLAPDTGEYEFVVKSDHAVRLWVNGNAQPLIDAWVKSGRDNEFHGVVSLLGGRAYPLRLEFSKSTQGVDDSEKKKGKPAPPASVELLWKRPKQAMETIPQRCLFPTLTPETFVVSTRFPPDDRSIGYERGTSVSKAWEEATTAAALEAAAYVNEHLASLSGARPDAPDRKAKLQAFCRQFVERALRRPLTDDVAQSYIDKQFRTTPDVETAVKRVVILTLLSPRFLYRESEARPNDAYDVASRLSFGLWDTLPDAELLKAASENRLATREQVATQAERMASDPRAWNKLRAFLLFWLKVDQVPDLAKNPKKYPDFDPAVASDLRASLELFLENTAWGDKSDYRELMTAHAVYLNGRLAKIYGVSLPADAPFQPVMLDASERSGVLTQPYLLSSFAYLDTSSPIHRGVLVARNLLGRVLSPPPAAFTPLAADLHPDMTTRQRVELQTRPAACSGCHNLINPLGFTLEKFDAIGRVRDKENGQAVDATGSYRSRGGSLVKFASAMQLGRYLADSDEAHAAFVEKLFQHLVKQPVLAYGPQTLPNLERNFTSNQYNIRKLMADIMVNSIAAPTTPTKEQPKSKQSQDNHLSLNSGEKK